MTATSYFWQGGRRIAIEQDEREITIHAGSEDEAHAAAAGAGVELRSARRAAPHLIQAEVVGDRDTGMERLRAGNRVLHHVYRDPQDTQSEYLITDSLFVKFKEGAPEHRIREFIATEHLQVERSLGDGAYLLSVTDATGRNPIRVANAAASRNDVEYAEPNLVRRLLRCAVPSDPLFESQWHLHAPKDVGSDLLAGASISAAEAWEISMGRREIVIAVADDGFDLTHPDFQGPGKVAARLNATVRAGGGIDWDADVSPRPGDYHGTPCLGVAAAEGNGTGVVGVAPGCAIVAVRFPLSMSDAHFITMFQKISPLADVISCSWGVGPADFPMSSALRSAIGTLAASGGRRGKGLLFCVAAGNNNCPVRDLGNTRTYRFVDGGGTVRSYRGPIDRWIAAHPDVITVSASTSLKRRAAYSSWGKEISVCAPSSNFDDLYAFTPPGRGIVTTDNESFGPGTDFTSGSRFTAEFGGTSSATPTVAGVCGLVLSVNPGLRATDVRHVLQSTADKDLSLATDTPVNEPGTFSPAGFSLWFGHGKVNAFKALQVAHAGVQSQGSIDVRQQSGVDIPDTGAVVSSALQIHESGKIADLRIQVDIRHTYIGDLRVDLIDPQGSMIPLHRNTGGSSDNLLRTYSPQEIPALRSLLGRSIRGTWVLQVRDTFRLDVGRLQSWRIAARLEPTSPTPAVVPH